VLNYMDQGARDALRIEHVRQIKTAVENYLTARRAIQPTSRRLPMAGFSNPFPAIRFGPAPERTINTIDGINNFGVLVSLERAPGYVPAGKACRTGLGTKESLIWDEQLQCPF